MRASQVVIINPQTLEIRGHPRADDFQAAMCESLLSDTEGSYTFVLDRDRRALHIAHWRQLLAAFASNSKALRPESTDADVVRTVQELEESGRLSVRVVASSSCCIPLVALDPQPSEACELYVWDWWRQSDGTYHDSIALMSRDVTTKWIEDFFIDFLATESSHLRLTDVQGYNAWHQR
jgi:hypothetical protein